MASSAKDIQLRELKDTVSQLKTMISKIQSRESPSGTGRLSDQKAFRLIQ